MAPSVPTWRKSRRVIPSQVVIEPFPDIFSIGAWPFLTDLFLANHHILENPGSACKTAQKSGELTRERKKSPAYRQKPGTAGKTGHPGKVGWQLWFKPCY